MLIIYLSLVNCAVLCITKHRKLVLTSIVHGTVVVAHIAVCILSWKIINNYWMRFSKISWFACGEQINYLPKLKAESIIGLRDTDKSRYFAITEFNHCFIIRSPSWFFLMNILLKWSHLPFPCKRLERSQEGEKHGFINAWEE